MNRNIGFTGTRRELEPPQMDSLHDVLRSLMWEETTLHHGDCVGADRAADEIAALLGIKRIAHPGPDGPARAYCESDLVHPQRPYLDRNREIVEVCDVLIACPKHFQETQRSGTWSTVRYARRIGRPTLVIWPDGTVEG